MTRSHAAILTTAVLLAAIALLAAAGQGGLTMLSADPDWTRAFSPGRLSRVHADLPGGCAACHTAYVGVEPGNCAACHADVGRLTAVQSTRFHLTVSRCADCHVEHAGRDRPIAMDHSALVYDAWSRGTPDPRPPLRRFAASLLGSIPEATSRLDCATCHSNRDPHRGMLGANCATCHGTEAWRVTGFRHPSPNSTDCAQCHQAPPSHYMGHFEMVSRSVARQEHARVDQCQICHVTDSWNNIPGVGWYKHH